MLCLYQFLGYLHAGEHPQGILCSGLHWFWVFEIMLYNLLLVKGETQAVPGAALALVEWEVVLPEVIVFLDDLSSAYNNWHYSLYDNPILVSDSSLHSN